MNDEEKKAAEEAAAKKAEGDNSELNKKLADLVKAVKEQNVNSGNADAEAEAKVAKELAAKQLADTQKAADIKKMLEERKPGEDFDFDDLKPKEILDIMADAFETSMEAKQQLAMAELAKPLEALSLKITGMEKYLIQNEAHRSITEARAKFPDFDEFKDDIDKLYEKYPGIQLDHAYMIVKSEKSQKLPPRDIVDTEKPVSLATRQSDADAAYKKRKEENKTIGGHRGLKAAMEAAAEKIVSARKIT